MADPTYLTKDPVLVPNTGYIFVAPEGTPKPALPYDIRSLVSLRDSVGTSWASIGNTSLENGISHASDGDDPEVLGTWQNPALRTTNPPKIYTVTLNLADFTVETYKLYYGGGEVAADGSFVIPSVPAATTKAMLIVAVDGDRHVVEYYERVSLIGSDGIEYDPSALTEMPVAATILGGSNGLGQISPVMWGAAVVINPPTLTTVTPAESAPGTQVQLTGTNLNAPLTVWFGPYEGTNVVTTPSGTQATVTVPTPVETGDLVAPVSVETNFGQSAEVTFTISQD
jgi:hypothetical protein